LRAQSGGVVDPGQPPYSRRSAGVSGAAGAAPTTGGWLRRNRATECCFALRHRAVVDCGPGQADVRHIASTGIAAVCAQHVADFKRMLRRIMRKVLLSMLLV